MYIQMLKHGSASDLHEYNVVESMGESFQPYWVLAITYRPGSGSVYGWEQSGLVPILEHNHFDSTTRTTIVNL